MSKVGDVIKDNKVLQIIIAVFLIIVVWMSYRGISSAVKKSKAKKVLDEQTKAYEEATPVGERPSFPQLQYKQFADKLYTAMYGAGTDLQSIKDVFNSLNNTADLIELIKAFGMRKGWGWFAKDENLAQWIAGDLSAGEIGEINAILDSKFITIKF